MSRQVRWGKRLADVDTVVVDRLCAGEPVGTYTTYERREAVRRLLREGLSHGLIAVRLRVWRSQVDRDVVRLGLTRCSRAEVLAAARARRAALAAFPAGRASTGELAARFGVDRKTIQKDLRFLRREAA